MNNLKFLGLAGVGLAAMAASVANAGEEVLYEAAPAWAEIKPLPDAEEEPGKILRLTST